MDSLFFSLSLSVMLWTSLCVASDSSTEANALLHWKSTFQNRTQLRVSSWTNSSGNSPCTWSGISCNSAGSVNRINLTRFGVKGTTPDDLFPLFDRHGRVVDVFIPRDRRTGDSRGFAFVRCKYADEAQKAVERLDGKLVDGREIAVQFAKYGPNAERIHKGKVSESSSKPKTRSRSRSPRPRYRDEYRDKDHRRRSRSRSRDRYDRERSHRRGSDYRQTIRSHSVSPDRPKDRRRGRYDEERRSRSRSYDSASPARRSSSPRRSPSPGRMTPRGDGDGRDRNGHSPTPKSISPRGRLATSQSPSARISDAGE